MCLCFCPFSNQSLMLLKHSSEGLIIHIPRETLFVTTAAAISKANHLVVIQQNQKQAQNSGLDRSKVFAISFSLKKMHGVRGSSWEKAILLSACDLAP